MSFSYYAATPYAKQHRVESTYDATDGQTYNAQVITHHRAPDLYEMVFGTNDRPAMNRARLRLA